MKTEKSTQVENLSLHFLRICDAAAIASAAVVGTRIHALMGIGGAQLKGVSSLARANALTR